MCRYLQVNRHTLDYPRQLFGYAQNIADGMEYLTQVSLNQYLVSYQWYSFMIASKGASDPELSGVLDPQYFIPIIFAEKKFRKTVFFCENVISAACCVLVFIPLVTF